MTGYTNGGTGIRGLAHGRTVPVPYSIARLQRQARPKEFAAGHRFGVFISDPSDSRARQLVASAVTFAEACEEARRLSRTSGPPLNTAHDRFNMRRTKHRRSNGSTLPPGWSVGRNRWERDSVWTAYKNTRPIQDFRGKRARQDAIAFCFEQAKKDERPRRAPELLSVDESIEALLRAAREEAGGRCG